MLKLIKSDPYFSADEPAVRIIDTVDRSGLIKAAADNQILNYVSRIVPESNKVYLHILAMGAGEYFGSNRNQDWFPENNLIDHYKTFETSPAHVFKNHVNKNPAIAIGQVVFAIYNDRMHRVELISWIDKDKGSDVLERIERGDFPATSMACRTPFDVCSICGNQAHTRQEYCEHLTEELGRMYPDGRKAMALNVAPLRFFDISIVVRPADVTSSVLQKVASDEGRIVGSAELAEIEGLTEKTATLKKLSEFIKEITDGVVIDADPRLDEMLLRVADPQDDAIDILKHYNLNHTFSTMGHLGISPTIRWLAELIARKSMGESGRGIGDLVAGYVDEAGIESLPIAEKDFGEISAPNVAIIAALMPSVKQASLLPQHVSDRVFEGNKGIYVQGTNVGYTGNGPMIEETPYEQLRRLNIEPQAAKHGGLPHFLRNLLVIGGAALAAKWYITHVIGQKIKEEETARRDQAKIAIVKSASDLLSTHRLAKAAMVKLFTKRPI